MVQIRSRRKLAALATAVLLALVIGGLWQARPPGLEATAQTDAAGSTAASAIPSALPPPATGGTPTSAEPLRRPAPRQPTVGDLPPTLAHALGVREVRDLRAASPGGAPRRRTTALVRTTGKYPWLRVTFDAAQPDRWEAVVADQALVRLSPATPRAEVERIAAAHGARVRQQLTEPGCFLLSAATSDPDLEQLPAFLARLATEPAILAAEPNGVGCGAALPADPWFIHQWGLRNTGQSSGTPGADVDASGLWDILTAAPEIVVAVIDSGLTYDHEDLAGVRWQNPGETAGNGLDDDHNGRIDDHGGWDFVSDDADPRDDHDHGTHVSGIIAARRDNAKGIAGLCERVRILPCKMLNAENFGYTTDLVEAIDYARLSGVRLMNLSLQNFPNNSSLSAAITRARTAGILLVICAGNQGTNNDTTPNYPSSFPQDNILSVGNTNRSDQRHTGTYPSCFGATSVDLFAPGTSIASTVRAGYAYFTGTSMAAPHVTGTAAMLLALNPHWTYADVRACLLDSVDVQPQLAGLCVTGGRLDARAAVRLALARAPLSDPDADGQPNLLEYAFAADFFAPPATPPASPELEPGGTLVLRYPPARTDLTYTAETSTDLASWTTDGIAETVIAGEAEARVSTGPGATRRFLRVRIDPMD